MSNKSFKIIFLDAVGVFFNLYVAFFLRFDFHFPAEHHNLFIIWSPWFILSQVLVFYFSGLYARIWRYTSLFDLYAILRASLTAASISFIIIFFVTGPLAFHKSVLLLFFIFNTLYAISIRLSVRVYYSHYHKSSNSNNQGYRKKILLIGAGKTGEKIAKEILTASSHEFNLIGFIDDNIEKHGALLHGKKIFCGVGELLSQKLIYDELLITAPSATGDQIRRIVNVCKQTGKSYKTVPSMHELINNEVSLDKVRDVSYSDLLGREEIVLDINSIENILQRKRVLITGAGGSIGSELVRQCMQFDPAEIICVDIDEESIYDLDQFSKKANPSIIFKIVLCSINNKNELEKVYNDNHPQIVFHAAAYKHVPIQEEHPWTAVNTNLGGTKNLIELASKYLVEKFVLVSTDKAVNPTNVMGATKRAAEKLIQSFNSESKTAFMSVRFGNVLGSSGSAIPTFRKQISEGGPITITHPEMTRYFMSIQEASQLILQCAVYGKDGEIFLLEMGKPIKILQMAKDLIRLSGLEPEVDIPIVYTGLRPGEKLYEELQLFNERKVQTSHKKIMILKENSVPIPYPVFKKVASDLFLAAKSLDKDKIQIILKQLLPTYKYRNFNIRDHKQDNVDFSIKGEA